jgi:hypothetical protein
VQPGGQVLVCLGDLGFCVPPLEAMQRAGLDQKPQHTLLQATRAAFKQTLKVLGTAYIDLLLLHTPRCDPDREACDKLSDNSVRHTCPTMRPAARRYLVAH